MFSVAQPLYIRQDLKRRWNRIPLPEGYYFSPVRITVQHRPPRCAYTRFWYVAVDTVRPNRRRALMVEPEGQVTYYAKHVLWIYVPTNASAFVMVG